MEDFASVTYKKPKRNTPDTCALRAGEICRVRIINRGMMTTVASRTMLIAAMESIKLT